MRGVAVVAVALALGSSAAARPAGESLVEFADRFDQAQLKKDGAALERMVADDLVFITGDGKRLGKKEFIEGWTGPDEHYDPITLVNRVVRPLGSDGGIVGAETVLSGTSAGKQFSSHFRYTDTFKRVGGEWRATYIQVTRIAN
jgi:ketosteroid isomerase-like protein